MWGSLFESGRGLTPDPARARELLEQACAAGSTVGCVELAAARAARMGSDTDLAVVDSIFQRMEAAHQKRNPTDEARIDTVVRQHQMIVDALRSGDAETAGAAAEAHLHTSLRQRLKALAE